MEDQVKLKADVKDLLNQLIIKLKDIKDLEIESDWEGYRRDSIGGKEEIKDDKTGYYITNPNRATDDERFLFSVREFSKLALEKEYHSIVVMEKYYTSTCY